MTYFIDVCDFHLKFGLNTYGTVAPNPLDLTTLEFRMRFLIEELAEFAQSTGMLTLSFDLHKIIRDLKDQHYRRTDPLKIDFLEDSVDALADLVYVALGTAHMMGLPFDDAWAEVQRANMTKERANGESDPRSKRGSSLDVVKPEGWKAPDHGPAIAAAFARMAK